MKAKNSLDYFALTIRKALFSWLVWTVDLTVEIKLCFQTAPAQLIGALNLTRKWKHRLSSGKREKSQPIFRWIRTVNNMSCKMILCLLTSFCMHCENLKCRKTIQNIKISFNLKYKHQFEQKCLLPSSVIVY